MGGGGLAIPTKREPRSMHHTNSHGRWNALSGVVLEQTLQGRKHGQIRAQEAAPRDGARVPYTPALPSTNAMTCSKGQEPNTNTHAHEHAWCEGTTSWPRHGSTLHAAHNLILTAALLTPRDAESTSSFSWGVYLPPGGWPPVGWGPPGRGSRAGVAQQNPAKPPPSHSVPATAAVNKDHTPLP